MSPLIGATGLTNRYVAYALLWAVILVTVFAPLSVRISNRVGQR